jgi:DNA-binding XRE family transcriptional regulator
MCTSIAQIPISPLEIRKSVCTIYGGAFVVQGVESCAVRASTQNLPLMRAFAAELRARRNALGVSQEELAHRCGVNRTFVAKMEIGQNQPSLTVLMKISEGLQVSLPALLGATVDRYTIESAKQ